MKSCLFIQFEGCNYLIFFLLAFLSSVWRKKVMEACFLYSGNAKFKRLEGYQVEQCGFGKWLGRLAGTGRDSE